MLVLIKIESLFFYFTVPASSVAFTVSFERIADLSDACCFAFLLARTLA